MAGTCFVIMPFGGDFDMLYERVYVPAIQAVGLTPLRADEIYDNQAILQDIDCAIREATVILADVTGRNPNVNYELGAAHALRKETVIVTADARDVPSDYRHLRYLCYNRTDFDWNRQLTEELQKTLETVLDRLHKTQRSGRAKERLETLRRASIPQWMAEQEEDDWEEREIIDRARTLGFQFQQSMQSFSTALMYCKDCHVMLESREGPVHEIDAAMACLLNEKVLYYSRSLPEGHFLRMRRVFFDLYATHAYFVDYLYDQGLYPCYTRRELSDLLEDEFCGQIFQADVRYLEENLDHDRFSLDHDQYYGQQNLPQERHPICFRNEFYVADVRDVYQKKDKGHCFYLLDGLLSLKNLGTGAYQPEESHWLADWNHPEPRCTYGDTVRFKIQKIDAPRNWGHVDHARNISCEVIERFQKYRD